MIRRRLWRRERAGRAGLAAAAAVLLLDGASLVPAAPAPPGGELSPLPYERIHARRDWRAPDGHSFAVCLLGWNREDRGRALAIYDSSGAGWRQVFLDDDRGFHPWAVEIGELDGDPLPEVVVGAYKASRFDPAERNRIFVFDWTAENELFAKWLGSRLGPTPARFALARGSDGRDRLLVRSNGSDGAVRRYRWNGFGFTLEAKVPFSQAPAVMLDDPPSSSTQPACVAGTMR